MIDPEDRAIDAGACAELWAAVIYQALADAHGRTGRRYSKENGVVTDHHAEARAWFEENGEDFRHVCELAGLDPDIIRTAALKPLPDNFSPRLDSFRSAQRTVLPESPVVFTKCEMKRLRAAAKVDPPLRRGRRPRLFASQDDERRRQRDRERNRRAYQKRKASMSPEEFTALNRERFQRYP